MSEMQATIEAAVQFHNFYNVDLFQRGFYQIRSYIKASPKLPIKVEVSLPRNQPSEIPFPACIINRTAVTRTVQILYRNEEVRLDDVVHFRIHAIVESGKIEETLEKADLQLVLELWYTESGCDVIQESSSRGDNDSSEDSGSRGGGGSVSGSGRRSSLTSVNSMTAASHSGIECVSSRVLRLNFNPTRGLHYHLPVLFDYFHLAAVSTTVHMVLSSLHQPYIKFSKNGTLQRSKPKSSGSINSGSNNSNSNGSNNNKQQQQSSKNVQARLSQPTMETIFFGTSQNKSSTKSCIESGARLTSARKIHHEVCTMLLSSLESLQRTLIEFSILLSENISRVEAKMTVSDCRKRLNNLSEMAKDCQKMLARNQLSPSSNPAPSNKDRKSTTKNSDKDHSSKWDKSRFSVTIDSEDEFLAIANSDISQLCGEIVLLWNNFLNICLGRKAIVNHLSRIHHLNRVKRFSEAFFLVHHSRGVALSCCEPTYNRYAAVSEQLRASKYLASLPCLPVSCPMLDGDASTLPIIFEDRYQDEIWQESSTAANRMNHNPNESDLTRSELASSKVSTLNGKQLSENRRHSCNDLATLDDSTLSVYDEEEEAGEAVTLRDVLITTRQLNQKPEVLAAKKPPRPSSIPAAKKFGRETPLTCMDLDYECMRQRLEKTPNALEQKPLANISDHQELQIVPNHFDHEDEPNILTATPCLPSKTLENGDISKLSATSPCSVTTNLLKGMTNGFSHVDWSSTVPYNLAEEPDIVQGMKHSHSCDSVPTNSMERQPKHRVNGLQCTLEDPPSNSTIVNANDAKKEPSDSVTASQEGSSKISFDITSTIRKTSATVTPSCSESSSSSDASDDERSDAKRKCADDVIDAAVAVTSLQRTWNGSRDSGKHSFSSSPSDPTNGFFANETADASSKQQPQQQVVKTSPTSASENEVKTETKKVTSTDFVSATITKQSQEELSRKLEEFRRQSRSTKASFIERPRAKSEEAMIKFSGESGSLYQPRCRLQSESSTPKRRITIVSSKPHNEILNDVIKMEKGNQDLASPLLIQSLMAATNRNGPKVSLPPPAQFRDPPDSNGKPVNAALKPVVDHEKSEKPAANKSNVASQPAVYEVPNPLQMSSSSKFAKNEIKREDSFSKRSVEGIKDDTSTIPLRRKSKPASNDSTASLPRTADSKRSGKEIGGNGISSNDKIDSNGVTQNNTSCPNPAVYNPPVASTENHNRPRSLIGSTTTTTAKESSDSVIEEKIGALVPIISEETVNFIKFKEDFKKTLNFNGTLYSDLSRFPSTVPYFHRSSEMFRGPVRRNFHLVVCVHGLEGNSADLRLVKTYLEMALPGHNLDFLMSEGNQGDTFSSFEAMTERLVGEILLHVSSYTFLPARISFVGHSLGCILIRSAISRPEMSHLVPRFYTYLALSGPHMGTLYNNSGLVNMGMWFMQKWKKSGSLHQLALKDATDIRQTFMYKLSQRSNLHMFKHVLLAGSTQDRYVPWHSARIELCKAAVKDSSVTGSAYREMVHNIIAPIVARSDVTLCRYDIHHALPANTTNTFIGRAAHIAVLDSELFIEKFLIISVIKYFQ